MSKPPTWQALARLSRLPFDASKIEEHLREINSGNDRAVAIVWGAMVEDALQVGLMRWMDHLTKDEQARLTEINGPLATFASKIMIAYGIRLVTKEQARDLNIIKEVRNAFAHGIGGLSFSTKEIADVCGQLSLVARIRPKGPINTRACYCATCLQIWSGMGGYGVSLGIKIDTGEMFPIRWEIGDEETP